MSWVRRFIRQHLIADDPAPEYWRLDYPDGLQNMPTQEPGSVQPARGPADSEPRRDSRTHHGGRGRVPGRTGRPVRP